MCRFVTSERFMHSDKRLAVGQLNVLKLHWKVDSKQSIIQEPWKWTHVSHKYIIPKVSPIMKSYKDLALETFYTFKFRRLWTNCSRKCTALLTQPDDRGTLLTSIYPLSRTTSKHIKQQCICITAGLRLKLIYALPRNRNPGVHIVRGEFCVKYKSSLLSDIVTCRLTMLLLLFCFYCYYIIVP